MKTIIRMTLLVAIVCGFAACSDDDDTAAPATLDVTPANIAGTWMLSEWNNAPLADGTYCYITFNRKERSFAMYQNFDSMYPRCITGVFSIEYDEYDGYIISGTYDYGMGEWNDSYIVTDLYAAGSMVWTACTNPADVCKYVRCDALPEELE